MFGKFLKVRKKALPEQNLQPHVTEPDSAKKHAHTRTDDVLPMGGFYQGG